MSEMLIKGMEMPKTGSRIIEINFRGEVFELFKTDNERGGFLKSRKLEAVELPPHGDLIDRQAVVKQLSKAWNVDDDSDFANKSVWRIIEKEAPTVLEASK